MVDWCKGICGLRYKVGTNGFCFILMSLTLTIIGLWCCFRGSLTLTMIGSWQSVGGAVSFAIGLTHTLGTRISNIYVRWETKYIIW